MLDKDRVSIDATFNGLDLEGRMYLIKKFNNHELVADVLRRLEDKDMAFSKIIEAVTATEYRFHTQ